MQQLLPFPESRLGSASRGPSTTRLYSTNPLIVQSDFRNPSSPYFLYLPHGEATIVFIDTLESILQVKKWHVWNTALDVAQYHPPYTIKEAPGKGLGMFAARLIRAGELILSERPLYVTRLQLSRAPDQNFANGQFHRAALTGLSPSSQAAILSLKNSYGPEYDLVPGILNTNFLEVDVSAEPEPECTHVACFPTLSRANHACSPSANYFFSYPAFAGQFWATRDIAPGEEITITYVDLLKPRAARRALLQKSYHFACTCDVCAQPEALSAQSDARREAVRVFDQYINESRFPRSVSYDQLCQMIVWAGLERLSVMVARILLYGSQFLALQRDVCGAKVWARKARGEFRKVEGEASYNVKYLTDIIRFLDHEPSTSTTAM